MEEELALSVPVRIFPAVLLPQQEPRHMFVFQLFAEVRQLLQEDLHALIRVCRIAGKHVGLKLRLFQVQKSIQA